MKFERIEPVNQIENNLFVRHKVEELQEGCLIQKCVLCGEIIEDYTPKPNSFTWSSDGSEPSKKGVPTGYVYINKSANTSMRITEWAIEVGLCHVPKEVIDCAVINS